MAMPLPVAKGDETPTESPSFSVQKVLENKPPQAVASPTLEKEVLISQRMKRTADWINNSGVYPKSNTGDKALMATDIFMNSTHRMANNDLDRKPIFISNLTKFELPANKFAKSSVAPGQEEFFSEISDDSTYTAESSDYCSIEWVKKTKPSRKGPWVVVYFEELLSWAKLIKSNHSIGYAHVQLGPKKHVEIELLKIFTSYKAARKSYPKAKFLDERPTWGPKKVSDDQFQ